jgi:hypothetical protein
MEPDRRSISLISHAFVQRQVVPRLGKGPQSKNRAQKERGFATERMALRERNPAKETAPVRETLSGAVGGALTASQSVLNGQRYRVVIERLSNPKFADFFTCQPRRTEGFSQG